jgi:hypothetical protein
MADGRVSQVILRAMDVTQVIRASQLR